MANEPVYMHICLEITMFELHRFEPNTPAETLLYRMACRQGLLPGHPYTVMSIRGGLIAQVQQTVYSVAKEA